MYSEAKKAYNVQYVKDKIKRIPLDVQREHYERIKAAADVAGESVNGYVKRAIDERMERASVTPYPSEQPERAIENKTLIQHNPPERRYDGGDTKGYREILESVEEIAADMYNADKPVEYTVNDLIEEIKVNAEVYVRQLKRTLVIRSTLLSGENRPIVLDSIKRHVFQELEEKVVSLLK